MIDLFLFAQKKIPSVSWGTTEIIAVLTVVVVGMFLYSGILKLLKIFFPEKFYVHLDPELENIIKNPPIAEIPNEVIKLLREVNDSIKDKKNTKRQEEILAKVKLLYEWHEPEEKFGKPQWFCICAMNKQRPDWDKLFASISKIDKDSEGIRGIVEDLKRAHKEWSESVITTNQQISQAMTSLIGYLSTMERKKNDDSKKET